METANALVFQKAVAKTAREKVGSNQAVGDAGDISKLFSELGAKVGPEVQQGLL